VADLEGNRIGGDDRRQIEFQQGGEGNCFEFDVAASQ